MSVQLGKGTDWKPYFTNSCGFCGQIFPKMRGSLPAQIYWSVQIFAGLDTVQVRGKSLSVARTSQLEMAMPFFILFFFSFMLSRLPNVRVFPHFIECYLKFHGKEQAKLLAGLLWGQGRPWTGGLPKSCLCATEASTHPDQHPDAGWKSCRALKKSKVQTQNEQHQAQKRKSVLAPGDNQEPVRPNS